MVCNCKFCSCRPHTLRGKPKTTKETSSLSGAPTMSTLEADSATAVDDPPTAAEAEVTSVAVGGGSGGEDSAGAAATAYADHNNNNNNAESSSTPNDNATDDDNVPPLLPPLHDTSIPPYSAEVTFEAIASYTTADLTFNLFYNGDAEEPPCHPIVLTTAGIGVPEFPNPEELDQVETIQRVIKRNKSQLFDKSKVLTNLKSAKPYLQKEVIRRSKLNNNTSHPAVKSWTCATLINWLKENPPPESEHDDIKECFNKLKGMMDDHYQVKSGNSDANMWRLVRLWECILHTSLRDDYKKRNNQLPMHVIDARNSPLLPKSYWEKVADLYNSANVISSRNLSTQYGEPFHECVLLKQPSRENSMTGESVKQFFNKQRGAFITIRNNINLSGNGTGSHTGNEVKDFTSSRRNKRAVANGPATGYGYIAFEQEGEFDDYVAVAREDVGATTGKTPRINGSSSTKRGSTGKSVESNKKSKSNHGGEGAYNLLVKMNGAMTLEMKKSELDQLRFQVMYHMVL